MDLDLGQLRQAGQGARAGGACRRRAGARAPGRPRADPRAGAAGARARARPRALGGPRGRGGGDRGRVRRGGDGPPAHAGRGAAGGAAGDPRRPVGAPRPRRGLGRRPDRRPAARAAGRRCSTSATPCFASPPLARELLARGADPNATFRNEYGRHVGALRRGRRRPRPRADRACCSRRAPTPTTASRSTTPACAATRPACACCSRPGRRRRGRTRWPRALDEERPEHVALLLDAGADPGRGRPRGACRAARARPRGPAPARRAGADVDRPGRRDVARRRAAAHALPARGPARPRRPARGAGRARRATDGRPGGSRGSRALARGERPDGPAARSGSTSTRQEVVVLAALRGHLDAVLRGGRPASSAASSAARPRARCCATPPGSATAGVVRRPAGSGRRPAGARRRRARHAAGCGGARLAQHGAPGPTTSRSPSCWSRRAPRSSRAARRRRRAAGGVAGGAGAEVVVPCGYAAVPVGYVAVDAARRALPRRRAPRRRAAARRARRRRSARGCWRRWRRPWPRRATPPRPSPTRCASRASRAGRSTRCSRRKEACFLEAYRHGVDVLVEPRPRGRPRRGRRLGRASCAPALRAYLRTLDERAALRPHLPARGARRGAARAGRARRRAAALRRALPVLVRGRARGARRPVPPSDDALFVLAAGVDQLVCSASCASRTPPPWPVSRTAADVAVAFLEGARADDPDPRRSRVDLTFTERETAFRDELRAWLAANDPGAEPEGDEDAHYAWRRDWQRRLYDGGWAAVHWPREYGGRGATLTRVGDLLRGARPRARAAAGQRARPAARRPDADGRGAPTSRRSASCRRSSPPRRSGARASPSPTPAPTSRR